MELVQQFVAALAFAFAVEPDQLFFLLKALVCVFHLLSVLCDRMEKANLRNAHV